VQVGRWHLILPRSIDMTNVHLMALGIKDPSQLLGDHCHVPELRRAILLDFDRDSPFQDKGREGMIAHPRRDMVSLANDRALSRRVLSGCPRLLSFLASALNFLLGEILIMNLALLAN
jgi:hypothetical protein